MGRGVLLAVIALGLVFAGLSRLDTSGPRSPYALVEFALFALMVGVLLWRGTGGIGLRLTGIAGAVAFVLLSVGFGFVYEATLTVDGTGIGGIHPDTRASYLLGLGDYVPLAIVTLLAVRVWRLDFGGAFALAIGKSLTEGLIFTGVLTAQLLSPAAPFAPLTVAYYALAYATFIALPLLVLAPAGLWSPVERKAPHAVVLIVAGFVLAFGVRLFWGLLWSPFATDLFGLPPQP